MCVIRGLWTAAKDSLSRDSDLTSQSNQEGQDLCGDLDAVGGEDQCDGNAVIMVTRVLVALWLPRNVSVACQGYQNGAVDAYGDEKIDWEHVCACIPFTAMQENTSGSGTVVSRNKLELRCLFG